jgi:hypothetical protein
VAILRMPFLINSMCENHVIVITVYGFHNSYKGLLFSRLRGSPKWSDTGTMGPTEPSCGALTTLTKRVSWYQVTILYHTERQNITTNVSGSHGTYSVGPSSATPRDESRGQRRGNNEKRQSQSADSCLSGVDSYYPL